MKEWQEKHNYGFNEYLSPQFFTIYVQIIMITIQTMTKVCLEEM